MAKVGMAGASEPGDGERLERARNNRKAVILGGLMAVGGVTGFLVGLRDGDALLTAGAGSWPLAMAVGIALSYLAAVIGGGIALARQTDEVELQRQYKAVAFAASVYVLLYPIWFSLWMGGLTPEPMHIALFAAFWLALAAASLFYRFR